ncbi:ABC-type branched-subunit amino acid transport system substrate-binding protein [Bradyrhizobium sp. LM2.7]
MTRILSGIFAAAFVLSASAAQAQDKPPLKIGGILDMSSLYADITGPGSETAAKMAAEDFGGEVLGRKIQVLAADHLNKADLSANIARDMLDNQGVEMIYDVAASATALAAGEIAKARNKIVIFNGPGSIRLTNEACGPYTVHYVFDTFGQANVTGLAAVKSGLDSWFFLTADYAFGQDLEKDTSNVVIKTGGKVLGNVRHPLNTSDFSSFLLQAQASKAKVIGAGECRRRYRQRHQAGGRVRHRQGWPENLAAARLRHRYRLDRPGDGAGPAVGGGLLLGPQ